MLSSHTENSHVLQSGMLISSDPLQGLVKRMWFLVLMSVGYGADPEYDRGFRMKQDKSVPVPTVTELAFQAIWMKTHSG